MEILLQAQSLSYQGRLSDFSVALARKQLLVLMGTNGAGKSTALDLLAGSSYPSNGRIQFDRSKYKLSYVPQNPPCYPYRSVLENLQFSASLWRLSASVSQQQIEYLLDLLDLRGWQSHLANQLSMGTQRRLGLAMGVIAQPDILLLDEPTAGLDPVQAEHLREVLSGLKEHCAILLSTHLQEDVELLADEVLLLHEGRTLAKQKVDDDFSYQILLEQLKQQGAGR